MRCSVRSINKMAKEIKTEASIATVKRTANKPEASVTLTIPASAAGTFPIGKVMLSVTPLQGELDLPGGGKIHGDRG